MVVVVDTLAVLHRCPGKVRHIDDWYALADVVGNASMPEYVCVQRKGALDDFSHLLQPEIDLGDEMLDVTIINDTGRNPFLAPYRENITVL